MRQRVQRVQIVSPLTAAILGVAAFTPAVVGAARQVGEAEAIVVAGLEALDRDREEAALQAPRPHEGGPSWRAIQRARALSDVVEQTLLELHERQLDRTAAARAPFDVDCPVSPGAFQGEPPGDAAPAGASITDDKDGFDSMSTDQAGIDYDGDGAASDVSPMIAHASARPSRRRFRERCTRRGGFRMAPGRGRHRESASHRVLRIARVLSTTSVVCRRRG